MSDRIFRILADFYRGERGLTGPVPLHEPSFGEADRRYVMDCLETGWVSSVGAYVDRLERDMAAAFGTRHAIATVNGTAALHLCLHIRGVGPGDLVVCPALTFIGTANAVATCHATPLFVDSDPESLGIDVAKLAHVLEEDTERRGAALIHRTTGRRIAAILPVHIFGHPVDMDPLVTLASTYGVPVIEDAAESIGSSYKGRPCGSLAPLAATSFNGNKIVTTGGGGAILTDDDALARRAKHLSTTARVPHRWEFDHDVPAFNYRMPNLNAALGCAQLEALPEMLESKRALAGRYAALIDGVDGFRMFRERNWARSNYWLNAAVAPDRRARDRLLEATNEAGIQTRPCWRLLTETAAWREAPRANDLNGARWLVDRIVNLPSSPVLGRPV